MQFECSNKLNYKSGINCVKCRKIVIKGIQTCPECQSWLHGDCFSSITDAVDVCWDSKCLRESDASPPLQKTRVEMEVTECLMSDLINAKEIIQALKAINSELESEIVRANKSRIITDNDSVSSNMASFEFTKPKYRKNSSKPSKYLCNSNPTSRPILTQNRFNPLFNMKDFPCINKIESPPALKNRVRPVGLGLSRKKSPDAGKIRLFADSHLRNCALKLKGELDELDIKGTIKPNAPLNIVTKDILEECSDANKNDFIVIMGGTNDIAKNESNEVVSALKSSLINLMNTNVIVIDVPFRHDLPVFSCVNKAVVDTNIKIKNICKHFKNVHLLEASKIDRTFHTRHGLHLNNKGKDTLCKDICNIIKSESSKREIRPVVVLGNSDASGSPESCYTEEGGKGDHPQPKPRTQEHAAIRSSSRLRKAPSALQSDFLC